MKRTTIYLSTDDQARLARLRETYGLNTANAIRTGLVLLEAQLASIVENGRPPRAAPILIGAAARATLGLDTD